jgi:hypothetical protein
MESNVEEKSLAIEVLCYYDRGVELWAYEA